jgi:hypothetical protein
MYLTYVMSHCLNIGEFWEMILDDFHSNEPHWHFISWYEYKKT